MFGDILESVKWVKENKVKVENKKGFFASLKNRVLTEATILVVGTSLLFGVPQVARGGIQDSTDLFARYPKEVAEIASVAGKFADDALSDLKNEKIAKLFNENPELVVRVFSKIARVASPVFYNLKDEKVADLFVRYPDEFIEIANIWWNGAKSIFEVIKNEKIAKFFVENPSLAISKLSKIADATGKGADEFALYALKDEKVADLFVRYPDEFIEIAKAVRRDGGRIGIVGDTLLVFRDEKVAELFVEYPKEFVKIARYTGNYACLLFSKFGKGDCELDDLVNRKISDLFARDPEKFVRFIKATEKSAYEAFNVLENNEIAKLFATNPNLVINNLSKIARITRNNYFVFYALGDTGLSKLFVENPEFIISKFAEIAKVAGKDAGNVFDAFRNRKITEFFIENPDLVISNLARIAKRTKENTGRTFASLGDEKIADLFMGCCNGKIEFNKMMLHIYSSNSDWLSKRIDNLNNDQKGRIEYIDNLSDLQVFGLVLSPRGFHASTNHLLFDRLKNCMENPTGEFKALREKLGKQKLTISDLFGEYGLFETNEQKHFVLRTIRYDRFYGKDDSLLDAADVRKVCIACLHSMNSHKIDREYISVLADTLDEIKDIPEIPSPRAKELLINKLNDLGIER